MTASSFDHARMTLDKALPSHSAWKKRLQEAVKSGERLDVDNIRRDDCCQLGKWLHSDGHRHYGHTPAFQRLISKHKEFHLVASEVAEIINCKNFDQVHILLGSNSQFFSASTDVTFAIMQLKAVVSAERSRASCPP